MARKVSKPSQVTHVPYPLQKSSRLLPAVQGVEGDQQPDDGPTARDHLRPAKDDKRPGRKEGDERDF